MYQEEQFKAKCAIPFLTGSLVSVSTFTSLEIPNGAVKMHSCVRSGLALQMWDIN
jgi:hypothetical protein